jgi:hypothetical protein
MKSPAGRYLFSRFMAGPSRVSFEWELAIVDPLLVARLDAKSLLGRAGRLGVAAYAVGKRCHIGPSAPRRRAEHATSPEANWASAVLSRRIVGRMLASYRRYQRETSLEMRQRFIVGDGPLRITEGGRYG